ncbi:uncharacterized protein LOC109834618 [Asparagus officinalis]|nr:uncharacterized protein LOC109834618 [Asparagus officinalis]
MDGIVPQMRSEHWRAYGSSNFKNYVSFGMIPSDKATIMLLLDNVDLATGKFFFNDSQTGTKQAYTFDLNWVRKHTRFNDEGEKPEGNRDMDNRIWTTYFSNKQQSQYKSGRGYLEALLEKLVRSKKKSDVSDFVMLQILYQLTMIWTPTARMNAPRHMFKYVARVDAVDHFPWATIIYKELWDSFKAVKKATKGLTYLSGCAPLLSLWYYEISNIKEPAKVDESKPPMTNWTLEGKKVGSLRTTTITKKSEAAIHILPEHDLPRYVHEEIKHKSTKRRAEMEEEATGEKASRKKRVEKGDDAYKKLVMLNEAYEQELVARGVDTMAIKAEIEKRFEEEKQIMPKKEEPQIERQDEAEKEEGKEEKAEGEGDQGQEVGIELEQSEARKVVEEVPKKKRGRKRREEGESTLGEFVQGLRARSRRTTKKPKSLESPYCTEMPKKKMKGKKSVVLVKDDDDKGETIEEKKPREMAHPPMRTSVPQLWRREKTEDEKKLLSMLNMGIPSAQDFDIRLPGTVDEGFYHNFTVRDVPDASEDENKWLQHFLTLQVDKRIVLEVEDQTINRYDILHLLRGGPLKDETVEALVARLRNWLKLPENAARDRKFAIITSYFSIWLLTASKLDERKIYKNYIKKHIDEGKDVLIIPICHADHWHVVEVNPGQKKMQALQLRWPRGMG